MKKEIQQIVLSGSLAKKLKKAKKDRPYVKMIMTSFGVGTLTRDDSLRVMRAKWLLNKQDDLWPRGGPLANVKIASMDEVAKYDAWVSARKGWAKGAPMRGGAAKGVPKSGKAAKGMPKPGAGPRGNRGKKCEPHPDDLRVLSAVKNMEKTVDQAFVFRKEAIEKARPGVDAIFLATGEAPIPFKSTYVNKAHAASRRNIVLTALLSEIPHLSAAMERGVTIYRLIEQGVDPPPCPGHPAYKHNIEFVPMSFRDLCR